MAHRETMLKARLASLDAQMPALTALYQSLSSEQKEVFDHGQMGGRHGGWFGRHHHEHDGDDDRGPMHHGDGDGDDDHGA
jgi:hypothetical protein